MRKNQKNSLRYALWLREHRMIDFIVFYNPPNVRKPGYQFRVTGMTSVRVMSRRITPTAADLGDVHRRMLNTIGECRGRRRDPRKQARAPDTGEATTTRRGAVRGPISLPCRVGRPVADGAETNRSATTRRDSRNSALRWRRSVPAPPTRRVSPTRPTENAGRYRRPNSGR